MSISGFDPGAGGVTPEEEEEQSFDEIVAQQIADTKFIEENTQLPGDVGPQPAPPPPPPVDTPTYEENVNLPGVTPEEVAVGEFAAPPEPELAPPALVDMLFEEQNTQLPPFDPFADYVYNESPLTKEVFEQQNLLEEIDTALAPGMGQELLDMTPERLTSYYETAGITPYGPLAALNMQVAVKNLELMDIEAQIDALNPETFTTQGQIDRYNELVEQHRAVVGDLEGLIGQYDTESGLLLEQKQQTLNSYQDAQEQWQLRYGPGGLHDMAVQGEGLLTAANEPGATPSIEREIYNALRLGYVDIDRSEGTLTPTQKLLDAQSDAREHNQRLQDQRTIIEKGATSQAFQEFRDDLGFQEFAAQLTTADVSPGLLEELGVSQVAARENPYGTGAPVPLQTSLVDVGSEYRGATGLGTLESLGMIAAAPFAPIAALPGGERLLQGMELPGRGTFRSAISQAAAGKEIIDLAGETLRQMVDPREYQYRARTADNPVTPLAPTTVSQEGFSRPFEVAQQTWKTYDDLPWYITMSGEIALDPLNFVSGAGIARVFRGAAGLRRGVTVEKGLGKIALLDAEQSFARNVARADADFLRSADLISQRNLGKIDTIKFTDTQSKFLDVGKQALPGVDADEAAIFSSRLTYRLYGNSPERWQVILNEELSRLAQRSGREIDDKVVGRFNKALEDTNVFARLDGSEFWKAMDGQFPRAMTDTPDWRQSRAANLTDPVEAGFTPPGDAPDLSMLTAVGYNPSRALDERWGDMVEVGAHSGLIPGQDIRLNYLAPAYDAPPQAGAVTEGMLNVLQRTAQRKNVTLETLPTTVDEYNETLYKVLGQRGKPTMPEGMTLDQAQRDPRYRALHANSMGQLSYGILPSWTDHVVTATQLSRVQEYSIIQGRNMLDVLAAPTSRTLPGSPFSQRRFKHIQETMPATEWQKAWLRGLARKSKKTVSDDFLNSLTWNEAGRQIRVLRGKTRKGDIRAVAMDYSDNAVAMFEYNRETFGKAEYRAVLGDLLTPAGEGRYSFTRPVKRPDGVTANGYARMSDAEIFEAFRNAPENIKRLNTYGPAITEIAETIKLMAQRQGDDTLNGVNPLLMADARLILDSIVDDLTQTADLAETKIFKDWIVSLYDKSALPAPNRPLDPRALRPDNPEMWRLDQGFSHLKALQAERAALISQQSQLEALGRITRYTRVNANAELRWDRLLTKPRDQAKREIQAHFKHPDSPMTMRGFYDLLRQMRFVGPGDMAVKNLDDFLKQVSDMRSALGNVEREIANMSVAVDELGTKLGVDVNSAVGSDIVPEVQKWSRQFKQAIPEYAAYEGKVSLKLNSPEAREIALRESTVEIAFAAAKNPNPRPAGVYTKPMTAPQMIPDGPRYLSRGAWGDSIELQQGLAEVAARFDTTSANQITFTELGTRIHPGVAVAGDDYVGQALLIHSVPFEDAAKRAGVSIQTVKRARQEINATLKNVTGVHPNRLAEDSKGLGRAIDIATQVVETEAQRTGLDIGKVEVVGGKVRLPDNLIKPVLDWIEEQQKLKIANIGPGDATKKAAEITRGILGPILDFMIFGTTDPYVSDRIMRVMGQEGAQFIRPRHQRALVQTFDPLTAHLPQIDWVQHGQAFDQIMSLAYDVDPVWGQMAKRLDPRHMGELTKMSKGVKIGDLGAFVAHRVYDNVFNLAARNRENITDIYSEIFNHLDEIVDGGPAANALYSGMFENSEELGLWLKWARTAQPDGVRNWDKVKENWGDITPHLSVAKMPGDVFTRIFAPPEGGPTDLLGRALTARGRESRLVERAQRRRALNRAPVLDDVKRMDDFINGRLDLSDLDESVQIEAQLWRDALAPKWGEIKGQLTDGISGEFRRGVHLDDLDNLFQLDHLDPYDAQKFSDNLGTKMAEIELKRLGYDPDSVPALMKMTQFTKHVFGYFWLRLAPRYVINNIYGNYMSIMLNNLRSDRARGVQKADRILRSLDNKGGSVQSHRMLDSGLTGTEFGRGGAAGELARRMRKDAPKELMRDLDQRTSFKILSAIGRPIKGYTSFNAKATDFFELDARSRVWSREFDHSFTNAWQDRLGRVAGLSDEMRSQLGQELELADIAKQLELYGLDDATRQRVFAAHNESIANAHLRAYHVTREVMRDYLMRNRFDNMMDQIFPYHFWMTKNLAFVTRTVLDRPATIMQGARVYDAWAQQWQGMPDSFKQKIQLFRMPGFMPYVGGEEVWIRPNNMTNPAFFIVPAVIDEMREAWGAYEDTPLYQRIARSTAGGIKQAWEELGYSPGPHWDVLNGALTSKKAGDAMKAAAPDDWVEYFQDNLARGYGGFMRPSGFEQDLLPLGGLEDVFLGMAGGTGIPGTDETLRGVYARGNQLVKGSAYSRFEVNAMGHILADMAREGKLGEVEVHENDDGTLTYDISPEVEDAFWEVHDLIVAQDWQELEAHPLGKQVLDRMYKDTGSRSGYNYFTGLSMTVYGEGWKLSEEATDTYSSLRHEDDLLPIPPGANKATRALIMGLNSEIEDAQAEQDKYLKQHGYSPESIAEANKQFEVDRFKIYRKAQEAGLEVPHLKDDGPNAANEWAFGKWNPETGRREGAHAPWLMFTWAANDTPEDIDARKARDADWQRRQQARDNITQARLERDERYGAAAPYWNEIDDIYADEAQQLRDLNDADLSENVKMIREDEIMQKTAKRIGSVYDKADANGVSLKGTGRPPKQTRRWYELEERFGQDLQTIYNRMGIDPGVPETMNLDDAVRLHKLEDQIEVHTEWTMKQVVDALDLNPYLPGGVVNPKFATDGRLDREKWENEVKRLAPKIIETYGSIVGSWRDGNRHAIRDGEFTIDLLARPIDFDEFYEFAATNVMKKQSAYDLGFQIQLDKVWNADGREERERLVREGLATYGPRFEQVANGKQVNIDMDDVARTITNHFNGLDAKGQQAFEQEWGDVIGGSGDARAVLPEKLTYQDAVLIAEQYGLEIPTYETEWQASRQRTAIEDTWERLSKDQQGEWKEALSKDERFPESLVKTITGTDKETNAPYSFEVLELDDLSGEQVRMLVEMFEIPLDDYFPEDQVVGGPLENQRTASPTSPKFTKMMEQAAYDKETEVVVDRFVSGEAFLSNPDDVAAYQEIQSLKDKYPELYEAGRAIIEQTGVSWEWLAENLEPGAKAAGEAGLNLQEFAQLYKHTLDSNDADRLYNERRKWLLSNEGQDAVKRDKDFFTKYMDDRDPLAEDFKSQMQNGTLFGLEGDDLKNWQEFYSFLDTNDHLYEAAQALREEHGVTWKQLAAGLEDGPVKDFAAAYQQRIENYDMGRLWDARADFFTTEFGQSLIARSPDDFARYADLEGDGGGSGKGSGGGSSRYSSGGGYRSNRSYRGGYSSSSARRPSSSSGGSTSDFYAPIREIFRLDSGMMAGEVPDAQARYDTAEQIAQLIQARMEPLIMLFGENEQMVKLFASFWVRAIKKILGDSPTLELWNEVLARLGGGEPEPQPSDTAQETLEPELEPGEQRVGRLNAV